MATSSIEWTELTWNPTTGCDTIHEDLNNPEHTLEASL